MRFVCWAAAANRQCDKKFLTTKHRKRNTQATTLISAAKKEATAFAARENQIAAH